MVSAPPVIGAELALKVQVAICPVESCMDAAPELVLAVLESKVQSVSVKLLSFPAKNPPSTAAWWKYFQQT